MAVARGLPSSNADGAAIVPNRTGTYGEAYIVPITSKELYSADEGTYYMALSPTPGTGILGTASIAAITDVSPTMVVYNGSSTGKRLYPQFLNLHDTAASSGGARVQFTWYLDNINRYVSSGTALAIGNTNSGGATDSTTAIHAGTAMVATAQSAKVLIDHVVFAGAIDIVENQYEMVFGQPGGQNGSNAAVVTTVQHYTKVMPPVCVLPGHSLLMHQWAGSQTTAPTFEYRFGYILR